MGVYCIFLHPVSLTEGREKAGTLEMKGELKGRSFFLSMKTAWCVKGFLLHWVSEGYIGIASRMMRIRCYIYFSTSRIHS